ncbi:glycosyltransferase family 2 protein [Brevibacterium sediminis]|uniref:Glucosyl-3-phosphoglycerate synthase n=1 Tax=Brevibacterium sediminis TaxID=1857024 RepID=A0A5C4X0Q1_9MICO|nr:glycosyltransferase family 2 protein [Brevibacterium sediminis]TNM54049.1 glycosyltransferase family 2 protein [Brevibacterium sediminis]
MSAQPHPAPEAVAAIIPAMNESQRIGATVAAAKQIPGVDMVLVVDDGSVDDTGTLARRAGAEVITHPKNKGKAAAMMTGAFALRNREISDADPGVDPHHRALLFIDGDLEDSAMNTAPLAEPVLAGRADMTIAILPAQKRKGGGFGFVVGLAKKGIAELSGFEATQPLSGMRCLSREAFDAAMPFAAGWGVEAAMTIDVVNAGLRVEEVECDLHHRVTGRDLKAQLHRAAQYRDVARAILVRRLRAKRNGGTPGGGFSSTPADSGSSESTQNSSDPHKETGK